VAEKKSENNQLTDFNEDVSASVSEPLQAPVSDIKPTTISLVLVVLSVVGLFFAATNWFNYLKIPFAQTGNLNINTNSSGSDIGQLLALQEADSDLDGLSDYDELYVYFTSPYLQDSDSDGFSDAEELRNNQDPNCPSGTDCSAGLEEPLTTAGETAQPDLPNSDLSAEEIRSLLIQNGISETELSQIDDQSLVSLYQQSLADAQNAGSVADAGSLDNPQVNELTDLLPPDQLRKLLIDEGIDEEYLNQLSDEELYRLFMEALNQ
jgi:hypothetical protein